MSISCFYLHSHRRLITIILSLWSARFRPAISFVFLLQNHQATAFLDRLSIFHRSSAASVSATPTVRNSSSNREGARNYSPPRRPTIDTRSETVQLANTRRYQPTRSTVQQTTSTIFHILYIRTDLDATAQSRAGYRHISFIPFVARLIFPRQTARRLPLRTGAKKLSVAKLGLGGGCVQLEDWCCIFFFLFYNFCQFLWPARKKLVLLLIGIPQEPSY